MAEHVQGVIPHLVVSDAPTALEFYKRGLGALETSRMTAQDGKRLLHAEMQINGSRVFIRDAFPEHQPHHGGVRDASPKELGGTPVTLHLEVPDCDEAIRRVAEAGATVSMPPMDAFWGARYGMVVDPFGHSWSFAHPLPAKHG